MKIVTIMDYQTEPFITMCKAWIYLANRYNPNVNIDIFYNKNIPEIRSYAHRFKNINFYKLHIDSIEKLNISKGYTDHPIQELQLALWREIEKLHMNKFLYIDSDAFILDNLEPWWRIIEDKPFISTLQRHNEAGGPLYNMGVFSYSSRKKFISLHVLYKQYSYDQKIWISRGEQGIINAYFRKIQYDPLHRNIGFEYNCFTKNCVIECANDANITVISGRYSRWKLFYKKLTHTPLDWWEEWIWWNKYKKVKILHSFGNDFKLWTLPECKKLWDYLQTKCT